MTASRPLQPKDPRQEPVRPLIAIHAANGIVQKKEAQHEAQPEMGKAKTMRTALFTNDIHTDLGVFFGSAIALTFAAGIPAFCRSEGNRPCRAQHEHRRCVDPAPHTNPT